MLRHALAGPDRRLVVEITNPAYALAPAASARGTGGGARRWWITWCSMTVEIPVHLRTPESRNDSSNMYCSGIIRKDAG